MFGVGESQNVYICRRVFRIGFQLLSCEYLCKTGQRQGMTGVLELEVDGKGKRNRAKGIIISRGYL